MGFGGKSGLRLRASRRRPLTSNFYVFRFHGAVARRGNPRAGDRLIHTGDRTDPLHMIDAGTASGTIYELLHVEKEVRDQGSKGWKRLIKPLTLSSAASI